MTTPVVLGLGANLDDRAGLLQSAVDALCAVPGLQVSAASDVYETEPVGGPGGQQRYLNAILLANTTLEPLQLLEACQQIEADHGRTREVRWGPRTLDIDVIAYGEVVDDDERLTLPHPRAAQRAFVLVPWAQVDPGAFLPGTNGGQVPVLATEAEDRFGVRPFRARLRVPGG